MRITEVSYKHKVGLPNYGSMEVCAVASVSDGETPEEAFKALVRFVENEGKRTHDGLVNKPPAA